MISGRRFIVNDLRRAQSRWKTFMQPGAPVNTFSPGKPGFSPFEFTTPADFDIIWAMIGVSKLLCGLVTPQDAQRYGRHSSRLPAGLLQFSADKKPIVVWNMTRACNLKCVHCYASASCAADRDEMSTAEAMKMIDDLAAFGVPTLLFSGGEPFLRKDLFELGEYAASKKIRTVISSNGTLIDSPTAKMIKNSGFSYVGVSLDGLRETNDRFRGADGAYDMAMAGIGCCLAEGIRVGLRFTINRSNYEEVPHVFDVMSHNSIPRVCFYHLVYSGRGSELFGESLPLPESRKTVEYIFSRTREIFASGKSVEVLTVDNHADGVLLYLKMLAEDPRRAGEIMTLLKYNGGNNSGIAIACVDWRGFVHADQFWRHKSFGNVRQRPFGDIWTDLSDPLLAGLKNRKGLLKGRCRICKYLDICNGNFRVRAEAVFGDTWAPDPACYLTDEEIGLTGEKLSQPGSGNEIFDFNWSK